MEDLNQIKRIIDLFKNKISINDLELFKQNANHRYTDTKNAFGNSYIIDEWVNYFEDKKSVINLDPNQIQLIFDYLKDYHKSSVSKNYNTYTLDKNFPLNINLELEKVIFKTLEIYTLDNNI